MALRGNGRAGRSIKSLTPIEGFRFHAITSINPKYIRPWASLQGQVRDSDIYTEHTHDWFHIDDLEISRTLMDTDGSFGRVFGRQTQKPNTQYVLQPLALLAALGVGNGTITPLLGRTACVALQSPCPFCFRQSLSLARSSPTR